MRLFALMPVRNEADRYLAACLSWHKNIFDVVFVYDDQSDDDTVEVARENSAHVVIRPDDVPSFLEHEGQFRQAAWDTLHREYDLNQDDWIMAIDADEFLVCEKPFGLEMFEVAVDAQQKGHLSVQIAVPEVWVEDEGVPMVRVDGFWPQQSSARYVRWQPHGQYRDVPMASGQVPMYAMQNSGPIGHDLTILHYGYCNEEDRISKYQRYTEHAIGHNSAHIDSILRPPTLQPWTGLAPLVYRGQ